MALFAWAPPQYIQEASEEEDFDNDSTGDEQLLSNHNVWPPSENGDNELLQLDGDYDDTDDQLLVLERQLQQEEDDAHRGCVTIVRDAFGTFLVRYPHRYFPGSAVILIVLFILCGLAGFFSYRYHPPQEFIKAIQEDATEGFETRGTYIKKGQFTARELYSEVRKGNRYSTSPDINLAFKKLKIDPTLLQKFGLLPKGYQPSYQKKNGSSNSSQRNKRHVHKFTMEEPSHKNKDMNKNTTHITKSYNEDEYISTTKEPPTGTNGKIKEQHYHQNSVYNSNGDHLFTEPPLDVYSYDPIRDPHMFYIFAFESEDPTKDLYDIQAMKTICDLEKNTIMPMFSSESERDGNGHEYVYSLPRIIANHFRKKCSDLTQSDLSQFKSFFRKCLKSFSYLFREGKSAVDMMAGGGYRFRPSTTTPSSKSIPEECQNNKDLILEIREYMVDKQFTNLTLKGAPLTYTTVLVFSGINEGVDFYHKNIENQEYKKDGIVLCGVNFQDENVKWDLFQEYLLKDTLWFALAIGLVFLVMFIYQLRIDLIISTVVCVVFGFIFAYFIYYFILKMKFFPFINLLALLVLIAVGADDVFVFFDIFKQMKAANPELPLERVISKTLGHAAVSVFVTSLTTSAAFFANSVSNITAIKVFGIFAGIAVIVNFVIMVLMIPAVIVLCELVTHPCKQFFKKRDAWLYAIFCCGCSNSTITSFASNIYDEYFPKLIEKGWFIFITVLGILGIGSGIVVFVTPRFKLPVSNDFQVFPTSNLIERWDLNIKNNFFFAADEYSSDVVTAYYLWGFKDQDAGNHWDPKDESRPLQEEPSFDFYAPETQTWLTNFCEDVKKSPYMPDYFNGWAHCNLNAYSMVAKTVCNTTPFIKNIIPTCCKDWKLPFDSEQLELCLPAYQALLFNKFKLRLNTNVTGGIFGDVIYDKTTNKVKGFLLLVQTTWPATFTYDHMDHYYNVLARGFLQKLETAPPSVKKGFVAFKDWFWLYDLQHSLATGTYTSIGLSLGVAFLVMLFTSLNVLVTIYAMLSITLAILCTVASIVFIGWHLNIIESVIISLSVGLSIDFTIHYGVAYRLSSHSKPKLRVRDSFHQVGPAVAMAALTTFLAGASIMPCRVLPYTKLGIFLMLVMTFAWAYANLFFQSLCRIIGPNGNFCQLSAICNRKKINKSAANQNDNRGQGLTLRRVDSDDSLLVTF